MLVFVSFDRQRDGRSPKVSRKTTTYVGVSGNTNSKHYW